jgi:hypothetical protein
VPLVDGDELGPEAEADDGGAEGAGGLSHVRRILLAGAQAGWRLGPDVRSYFTGETGSP